jgi:hypothetical protein
MTKVAGAVSVPYEVSDHTGLGAALTNSFERREADELLVLNGECPRCSHRFQAELPLTPQMVVPGRGLTGMSASGLTAGPVEHIVRCGCAQDHEGRPAEEKGCGAMAKLVVRRPKT